MTLIVNLFGAPCSGKSTTRAGVFYRLKCMGINVEETTEIAKDFVYEERTQSLKCQPYLHGKGLRNIHRLLGKVDVILADGPLMLCYYYAKINGDEYPDSFYQYIVDQSHALKALNFYLTNNRNYSEVGRLQNKDEAAVIGHQLKEMLIGHGFKLTELETNNNTCDLIVSEILSNLRMEITDERRFDPARVGSEGS